MVATMDSEAKTTNKTYEVQLIAPIILAGTCSSQTQPKDAIALPTSISFNKNPLVQLKGKMKEVGKMDKCKEKTLGIEQWQYSGKVDFVRTTVLKNNVKTNFAGTITYQTCDEHQCLPPKTERFSVVVE